MILALIGLLTGCGSQSKVPDDYATNEGYQTEKADAKADTETNTAETTAAAAGIAKVAALCVHRCSLIVCPMLSDLSDTVPAGLLYRISRTDGCLFCQRCRTMCGICSAAM